MNITVFTVSDNDKQFSEPINEYIKRIISFTTIVTIKPTKHGSKEQIIAQDTVAIIEAIKKKKCTCVILLSEFGKQIDSFAFSDLVNTGESIGFIIGGAFGVDCDALSEHVTKKIALGSQTMPHGLTKLVLLEQVYRAWTISVGKTYHY